MDTQLDARVQFPASFPDTFKNFFDMMNEDEDHEGLFAHMLEDKVIPIPRPKPRKMHPQRGRCGGSLRSREDSFERSYRLRLQRQQQQHQQQLLQDQQYQHRQHLQQVHNMQRGRRASISGDEFYRETSDITESLGHYHYLASGRVHTLRSSNDRNAQHINNPGRSQLGIGPSVLNPNVSSSSSGSMRQLPVATTSGSHVPVPVPVPLGEQRMTPLTGTDHLRFMLQAQPDVRLQLEASSVVTSSYTPSPAEASSEYCPRHIEPSPDPLRFNHRLLPVNGARDVAEAVNALERMELQEDGENVNCLGRSFDCENSPMFEMERVGVVPQRLLPIPPVHSRRGSGGYRGLPVGQPWVQQDNDLNRIPAVPVAHGHNQIRFVEPRNIESVEDIQAWQPPPQYEEYILAAQHPGGSRQEMAPRSFATESSMQHSGRHYVQPEVHPRILHSVEHRELPEGSRVLTMHQAMSGAVSPQYGIVGDHQPTAYGELRAHTGMAVVSAMSSGAEAIGSEAAGCNIPKRVRQVHIEREPPIGGEASTTQGQRHSSSGILMMPTLSSRLAPRQRRRTSSMPAECRRPQHAEMRQAVKHAEEDQGIEYYRLRSFSITSNGVCNLGDSLRSRRSRSNNSVTSGGTSSYSGIRNNNRDAWGNIIDAQQTPSGEPPTFKIAMLGSPSVGKSALSFQFTTSDYICAYDLSLEMEYGQKTVSVLVDDVESDIEVVDHPACEMSTEAFCATYNIDLFVVVYSVLDVRSFRNAERVLHYLRDNDMLLSRGAILVGNKADLERHRTVPQEIGHKVATEIPCKFIETSAGLCHNVNELLVGVVAQVKLNPQRLSMLSPADLERVNMQSSIQNHRRMHLERQLSLYRSDHGLGPEADVDSHRPPISLKDILNVGESDREDGDESEAQRRRRFLTQFELLAANLRNHSGRPLPISPFSKRRSIAGNATATSDNMFPRLQRRATDDSHLGGGISTRSECRKPLFHFSCNGRVKKMTARTKGFVSSLLRFKASHWLSRRTSSSCTDLFGI
ncbi:uncharacterized protein LOC111066255 [Drosophila obscura]|uniref:uncharacterized protein LOC111066255 n=1 Tax=Drosophila obscura TaxID=7282 RepID=UPI001BB1DA30|nr:uncharacterized protein LOC111066255 [Drosophila obscura]